MDDDDEEEDIGTPGRVLFGALVRVDGPDGVVKAAVTPVSTVKGCVARLDAGTQTSACRRRLLVSLKRRRGGPAESTSAATCCRRRCRVRDFGDRAASFTLAPS